MRKLYITFIFLVMACSSGSSGGSGGSGNQNPPSAPQNLIAMAVDNGLNLKLVWSPPKEGIPNSYEIICDGSTIAANLPDTTTTYIINGNQHMCNIIELVAVKGSERSASKLDITPTQRTLTLYRDGYNGNCNKWAKVVFDSSLSITSVCSVNPNDNNTGYFYYSSLDSLVGYPAKYIFKFYGPYYSYLAPDIISYKSSVRINNNSSYFYWADNSSTGNNSWSINDYFGRIDVKLEQDANGWKANLTIYTQNKVPGLRWIKVPFGSSDSLISPPTNLQGQAVNSGADLKLTWSAPIGGMPDSYEILCDGSTIAANLPNTTTTYTIQGSQYVCKQVQVVAVKGSSKSPAELDLTPDQKTLTLYRTDYPGNCPPITPWAKITFGSSVSATTVCIVNIDTPNTGYFVYFQDNTLRDVVSTSINLNAKYQFAFSSSATGYLAPGQGQYSTIRYIQNGYKYFYWADNTSTGYGIFDTNDYFGRIDVSLQQDVNGWKAILTIYTQNKVPGLRWVKP